MELLIQDKWFYPNFLLPKPEELWGEHIIPNLVPEPALSRCRDSGMQG